jgi:hypothetical protein
MLSLCLADLPSQPSVAHRISGTGLDVTEAAIYQQQVRILS